MDETLTSKATYEVAKVAYEVACESAAKVAKVAESNFKSACEAAKAAYEAACEAAPIRGDKDESAEGSLDTVYSVLQLLENDDKVEGYLLIIANAQGWRKSINTKDKPVSLFITALEVEKAYLVEELKETTIDIER